MKTFEILATFIGGAAVGVILGILFAPDKGEETRKKIKKILKERGIHLNDEQMEEIIDKITEEVVINKE